MNNDTTTEKNETTKAKVLNILGYGLCFLVVLAIILGIKSCVKGFSMPKELKEAEKVLKKEGFSCRYLDEEDELEEFFDELDLDAEGVEEALVAYDEDTDDLFLIVCCDDVSVANSLEDELAWELAGDDYLYYRGYSVKVDFRTVYFGHEDLIVDLLD